MSDTQFTDDQIAVAAREVLSQFGLSPGSRLTLLAAAHNHVFRVDDRDQRFVLRLQSGRLSGEATTLQMTWLRAIRRETGLSVPAPVPTITGAMSVSMEGTTQSWALLTWVDGEPFRQPDAFVTPSVLEKVGETIARLHAHASGFRADNIGVAPAHDVDRLVGRQSCLADGSAKRLLASGDYAALAAAASKIAATMESLTQLPDQNGLIHGDLEPGNWVCHGGEPRVIDFDEFGYGLYALDLMGVLWTHISWKAYPFFRSALLKGYTSLRSLPPEVCDALDLIQAAYVFGWLNNGCRLNDRDARNEFLKWVPSTTAAVSRLCGVG